MIGERARELVVRGIEAARMDRREEARRLLERALESEPAVGDMIRAWQWLSEIADSPDARRTFVEKMLAADPSNGYARRELAVLNGALRREDVIDPDRFQAPSAAPPRQNDSGGLACRHCGSGRMVGDPRIGDLRCQHCGHRERIAAGSEGSGQDVTATLWSARGRRVPQSGTMFACRGCGAAFLMAPESLSTTCPYCRAAYVARAADDGEFIEPDGIVPFVLTSIEAGRSLAQAGVAGALPDVRGLYVPAWLFSFSGEVDWGGRQRESSAFGSNRRVEVSGTYTVVEARACVPAGRRCPDLFQTAMLQAFDWQSVVPYQPSLLASWPAETYQINLEAATVAGRRAVIPAIRSEVQEGIDDDIEDLRVSTSRISADSFRLVLVPLWCAGDEGESVQVFVNGQSGAVYLPEGTGLMSWLSGLFRPPR